jgi:lipoprotein-anchoring transpeptidase ErfK/SrfK
MYRFATLATVFACLASAGAAAAELALPDTVEMAQIRPSMPAAPGLVEEAALTPPTDVRAPVQPALNARLAAAPKLVVKVDISDQTMKVMVEGEERYDWKVSTAGKGYRTPTGIWTPYRMHTMWHSRKYDMAPMPHSIFFTGGYAIHATPHVKRLGRPASHGCVRLHPENAKELFALAKQYGRANMRVVVQE